MNGLYIDNLSGEEFENYLHSLFEGLGYEVERTPASNDYGADLIIRRNEEKIVVQAKRYSSSVGISAIQEIVAAKSYYQADRCLVVTNNYFTSNAVSLANANDVELWDREQLIEMAILSVNPEYSENSIHSINRKDELLKNAIELILEYRQVSVSLLQRKLNIGYADTMRIIDELEEMGIIGKYEKSKPRKILILEDRPSKWVMIKSYILKVFFSILFSALSFLILLITVDAPGKILLWSLITICLSIYLSNAIVNEYSKHKR